MTFWYLATPYSKYPHGIEEAFKEACRQRWPGWCAWGNETQKFEAEWRSA